MGLVFALILVQKAFIIYTDYLWFQSLGQGAVFGTIFGTRVLLGVVVGVVFCVWLVLNLRLARKPLPGDVTLIGKRLLPAEERDQIEQYADKALLVFAITAGVLSGIVASGKWREFLQMRNAVSFGDTDALFGLDVSFYVFQLPFLNYVVHGLFYGVLIALVVSVLVHIYQESIRIVGNTVHAIPRARTHVLGLLGLALLIKAGAYRLAQYGLLYSGRGEEFFGPAYADVHGRLPVLYALIALALVAGLVMFVSIRLRSLKVPAAALALVVVVSLLGGWIYPAMLQQLVVKPNQLTRERPFIKYNIDATLKAHDLHRIKAERHVVKNDLSWADVQANRATIDNIRLWDHRPLETTFQQLQGLRSYYRFADVDVDRYWVDGQYRQVMLAARQLDYSGITRPNWVNQHLLYTHGYGLCLSPVNEVVDDGLPNLWVKDFPPVSSVGLNVTRPQLYFYTSRRPRLIEYISSQETVPEPTPAPSPDGPPPGGPMAGPPSPGGAQPQSGAQQQAPTGAADVSYVICNTKLEEFDYPRADANNGESENATTRYQGQGGVQLSSWWRRLCFSIRFRDIRILLTNSITPESRILFNRAIPERLMMLGPFVVYDPDPYLVIAKDGTLKWICDAYTGTNMYPYSARLPWFGASYIRNSIKVVTDAYEGNPVYYVMPPAPGEKQDPIVQSWRQIFPSLFTDLETMDSQLQEHLRYPALLFRVQAEIYAKYHMTDPQTFFQKEDLWAIPPEIYSAGKREVEAYYVNMKLPTGGLDHEEFLLMLPFTLAKREDKNMVAWMAARCDQPNYGELVVYEFPKSSLVQGPMQLESRISQDAAIAQLITLWSQKQSAIIRGNLLVIPVGDSLLYVEPFYLEAPNSPLPQLKLVVMGFKDRIVNAPTLEEALLKLFGKAIAADEKLKREAGQPQVAAGLAGVRELLQRALKLDQEAQEAMAGGDLAGYQARQREQAQIIEQAKSALPAE
jgi:hypothetical protein